MFLWDGVRFTRRSKAGCGYKWTWAGKAQCWMCRSMLAPSPCSHAAPRGVWGQPQAPSPAGDDAGWVLVAGNHKRRAGRRDAAPRAVEPSADDDDAKQPKIDLAAASRALGDLRRMPGLVGDAELEAIEAKLAAAKKLAMASKPLSTVARTIEGKVSRNKKTLVAAEQRLEAASTAVQEAEAELLAATQMRDDRASDLRDLEAELAALPTEVGTRPVVAALPLGLLDDAEAVAAHEVLAAKLRALSGQEKGSPRNAGTAVEPGGRAEVASGDHGDDEQPRVLQPDDAARAAPATPVAPEGLDPTEEEELERMQADLDDGQIDQIFAAPRMPEDAEQQEVALAQWRDGVRKHVLGLTRRHRRPQPYAA